MRSLNLAPVDTMGCEALAEVHPDPKVFRYQTLISLMLSSQTRDEMTAAAVKKLQHHGLTVTNIISTPDTLLNSLISNVGFHRRKTEPLSSPSRKCSICKETGHTKKTCPKKPRTETLVDLWQHSQFDQ
eukprot:TRINITY_DN381_c0_g1_i10.p1 TRINITY_DN381_c0_g1~~TRINITY_DN381_c0_g1_i10.p1  ORF type:complete len:147 (-),score=35.51 TRINITY_DN381_c0_g1_i10:209-595(-)